MIACIHLLYNEKIVNKQTTPKIVYLIIQVLLIYIFNSVYSQFVEL